MTIGSVAKSVFDQLCLQFSPSFYSYHKGSASIHTFVLFLSSVLFKSGHFNRHVGSISRWGGGANFKILRFLRDRCIALKTYILDSMIFKIIERVGRLNTPQRFPTNPLPCSYCLLDAFPHIHKYRWTALR